MTTSETTPPKKTTESSGDRAVLLQSAISFLNDPKVQSAPLTRKIAFLESKGLNSTEIQEAIAAASSPSTQPLQNTYAYPQQPHYTPYYGQQQRPLTSDWKVWVILFLASGQLGYTLYKATKVDPFPRLTEESTILTNTKEMVDILVQNRRSVRDSRRGGGRIRRVPKGDRFRAAKARNVVQGNTRSAQYHPRDDQRGRNIEPSG